MILGGNACKRKGRTAPSAHCNLPSGCVPHSTAALTTPLLPCLPACVAPAPLHCAPPPAQDDMRCAEDYVRFCCKYLLEHCMPDLAFINKMIDATAIARLQQVGLRTIGGRGSLCCVRAGVGRWQPGVVQCKA